MTNARRARPRARAGLRAASSSLVIATAIVACAPDATQLIVVIDTDIVVPGALDRIQVTVEGPTATSVPIDLDLSARDAPMLPVTLGVSPAGDALGPVTVTAIGTVERRFVVEASARTTLVRGESRVLWLFLARSCIEERCTGGTERTCRDGQCVPIDVPWSSLPRWSGRVPARDGSRDAGRDAASDAIAPDARFDLDADPGRDAQPSLDLGQADSGRLDASADIDVGPEEDSGPPPPPCPSGCDDGMACTIDVCDLMLGRCVFTVVDADEDGHGDAACGGDDCDDDDAAVHPGATEVCDGDDDDCNGTDDDGCPCTPPGATEACTTTCGSTGRRTCAASGWLACVPPSEVCNAVDDDCDGHVDEGHTYVATGNRTLTSNGDPDRRPVIAANGAAVVTAWQHDRAAGDGPLRYVVDAMPLGSDGASLGSASRISGGSFPAVWPAITAMTDGFAVVWWDYTASPLDGMSVVSLDAMGRTRGTPSRVEMTGATTPSPALAWTGTELGIAYDENELRLERFDPAGTPLGGTARVPRDVESDQIAMLWTGVEYALAWRNDSEVYLTRGVVEPFRETIAWAGGGDEEAIALAMTSRGFMIATGSIDGFVRLFVSTTGGATFSPPITLTTSHPTGSSCLPDELSGVAAVSAGPDQVLVLFTRGPMTSPTIALARFAADGSMLQPATDLALGTGAAMQPSAVWVGDHAVLVWSATPGDCREREIRSASIGCP